MRLRGLVAIVTGATSGLGEAIARRFAREGALVAVIGRDEERGERVVSGIAADGGTAAFIRTDVTKENEVREMVENVLDRFGKIDIVVNNAGLVIPGDAVSLTLDEWETVFAVNVTSCYLVSRHTLPHLLKQGSGVIINVSSEAGLKGIANRAAYCAAKSAIIGFTKAMAVDYSPRGVRVNCICPGTVETPMVRRNLEKTADPDGLRREFLQRRLTPYLGTPEEIAEAALFLALPENRYVTGTILSVDGGASAK
jgi:NAD(P)-dependent dehydrogenase (short-subunit alcohol dehydrogenase family)